MCIIHLKKNSFSISLFNMAASLITSAGPQERSSVGRRHDVLSARLAHWRRAAHVHRGPLQERPRAAHQDVGRGPQVARPVAQGPAPLTKRAQVGAGLQ